MKVVNDLSGLTKNGFESHVKQFDSSIFESSNIVNLICPIIDRYFSKTKTFCYKSSSYGIKHIIEKYLGQYVSNGELIFAMNKEGYSIKRDQINCYFNIKEADLNYMTDARVILDKLLVSVKDDIRWHVKMTKKYQKNKYNFRCIIDSTFSQNRLLKRYVIPIISKEIGEDVSTVRYWFDLHKDVDIEIPIDKYNQLKNIFGCSNDEYLKNNEA